MLFIKVIHMFQTNKFLMHIYEIIHGLMFTNINICVDGAIY
jgi:hypothetical protein